MKLNYVSKAGISAMIVFLCFLTLYAQEPAKTAATDANSVLAKPAGAVEKPKPKTSFVKLIDFYLRNNELVYGKLIDEDAKKITVEQHQGSKMTVNYYSKRELDGRTIHTQTVPEYKYDLELADYFAGRVWDFENDTDEFIYALRYYEDAKKLLAENSTPDPEKIKEINDKIAKLQADKKEWVKQAEARAALVKLEFQITFEKRLKDLEEKVNSIKLPQGKIDEIEKALADIKQSQENLNNDISAISQDLSQQVNRLDSRINENRDMIYRNVNQTGYIIVERDKNKAKDKKLPPDSNQAK